MVDILFDLCWFGRVVIGVNLLDWGRLICRVLDSGGVFGDGNVLKMGGGERFYIYGCGRGGAIDAIHVSCSSNRYTRKSHHSSYKGPNHMSSSTLQE